MTPKELFLEAMRRQDSGDHEGFLALQAEDCDWTVPGAELHGRDAVREWTRGYSESLRPYAAGAGYVNFMMDDEGQSRVQATYGANYPRLAQVKASYDPDNVFRVNQNILPAAA